MRFADVPAGVEGWNQIRVVAMEERSPHYRFGEIEAPASVGIEGEFKPLQPAIVTKSCREASKVGVPFAG